MYLSQILLDVSPAWYILLKTWIVIEASNQCEVFIQVVITDILMVELYMG